ncbi:MAG: restriction endonuclease subunit S [Microcystis sp. LE19-338.1B]|jgi:type I restriction enzyme S subunit|nr:restriction endonuclease subunit S [Microcystis sp. LE19-338.1B]MCZ8359506.1 restriction endonuclease subunit S [Microcystis sp. LE19-388.1G]
MSKPTKLPEGWKLVSLGEVGTLINGDRGKNYPSQKDFVDNGVPFINAGHIQNGEIDFESMNFISRKRFDLLGSGKVKSGDILYCLRGSLGKTAIIKDIQEGAIASSLVIIRPSEQIRTDYFYRYLASPIGQAEIYKYDNGSSQPNLSAQSLKQYQLPLPPLEEQRRIAAILDKADGVRRKRKEAIRLTEELLKSTFLEMFGDPVTNPKGWEIVNIENIIELVSGQVDPRESPYSNMLHVGGDNIESRTGEISGCKTPAELSLISGKYLFRKGDILYSKIRPYLNKVSLPDFDGVCSADIYPIRVNHSCVTPIYMTYILRSKGFLEYAEKHSTRTNIPKINRKALLSFECPLPPLGLQNQFTNSANKILKIKDHLKTGVDKANNLFNSLLQRAFRGEL